MSTPSIRAPLPVAFWTDPTIRRLSKPAQGLAAFLLTRTWHSGTTVADVAQKCGAKPHNLRGLFKELEAHGLAWIHRSEVKLTGLARLKSNGDHPT